jgi:DNA-binding XRE family transcriptional regulator
LVGHTRLGARRAGPRRSRLRIVAIDKTLYSYYILSMRKARQREQRPDGGDGTIHNRLAVLRAERGLSRQELADALGVNYQTIGYLERGDYNPSLELAFRAAEFFGLPIEAIFSRAPFRPLSEELYGRGRSAAPAAPAALGAVGRQPRQPAPSLEHAPRREADESDPGEPGEHEGGTRWTGR